MPRPLAAIRADLAEVHVRHGALLAELASVEAAEVAPLDGPLVCRKEAAAAVGWRVDRLMRAIAKHDATNPHDRIGWQPGGNRSARWEIRLGRLKRFVRDLPTP